MSEDVAGFPIDAVRDLLGVVRAVYTAAKEQGASPYELRRIAGAGAELADAIELATSARPGSRDLPTARSRAEQAARRMRDLDGALPVALPLVAAACARVLGFGAPARRAKRPER